MTTSKKLAIVGSGIKVISHLTTESIAYIQNADKVLYLVNEPIIKEWIVKNSKSSESFDEIYFSHKNRQHAYSEIANRILNDLNEVNFLCVVIYGHPCIFATPGLQAALSARKEIETIITPGISAADCLYSDLRIDPGERGCYQVEATELLIYKKTFDPTSHLIIWQAGLIGNLGQPSEGPRRGGVNLLKSYLLKFYPSSHAVTLYEASLYPGMKPTVKNSTLSKLSQDALSPITTIYICPTHSPCADKKTLQQLGMSMSDLNPTMESMHATNQSSTFS